MRIYCRNLKCKHVIGCAGVKLPRQNDWELPYTLQCTGLGIVVHKTMLKGNIVMDSVCECQKIIGKSVKCDSNDCIWRKDGECSRTDYIEITNVGIGKENKYVCKQYALNGVRGHIDFMNIIPKESHIDDDYSEKLDHDNKVSRSYPTHLRQKKEKKGKK